jgi:hypothetical protein
MSAAARKAVAGVVGSAILLIILREKRRDGLLRIVARKSCY